MSLTAPFQNLIKQALKKIEPILPGTLSHVVKVAPGFSNCAGLDSSIPARTW